MARTSAFFAARSNDIGMLNGVIKNYSLEWEIRGARSWTRPHRFRQLSGAELGAGAFIFHPECASA
jgi:hypothetical protein